MPTPPPLWMLTQLAPAAVFTRALSSGQSAMASEPSRMPSVSRNGEATEPVSRWSRPIGDGVRAVAHAFGLAKRGGDGAGVQVVAADHDGGVQDRKSKTLNSSHL